MDSKSNPSQDSGTAELAHPVQSARRRTQRLIDPQWQLGAAFAVTMGLLGTGAVYMMLATLMDSPRMAATLGTKGAQLVGLGADIVFFLSVAAAVHHIVVRLTHSVVGPAFAIERAIRGMQEGDFDTRLTLRDGDYLTTVAGAARDLEEHLGAQTDQVAGIVDQLRSCAKGNPDVQIAADRLSDLFGMDAHAQEEAAAQAPADDASMAA